VHVKLLKKYNCNVEPLIVARATTILEPDRESDDITDRFTEVTITGDELSGEQKADIESLEEKHKETLTSEPSLTKLATFGIDTGYCRSSL